MSKEVKKYKWFLGGRVEYTLEEYISKVDELIYGAVGQMRECDGDLFMSEYQKLMDGADKLNYLNSQLKKERAEILGETLSNEQLEFDW
jgi:hypothetical protein